LVNKAPEIDLFLGGHDHDYYAKNVSCRNLIFIVVKFFVIFLFRLMESGFSKVVKISDGLL